MIKKITAAFLVASLAFSAFGCAKAPEKTENGGNAELTDNTKDEKQIKDTLVFAYTTDPEGLDPQKTAAISTLEVASNIFDTLLTANDNWEVIPSLAKEYTLSEDGLSITFKLNEGVKFHNGREMTAEDVKYSFMRLKEEDSPKAKNYANITEINVIDDYTIEFKTAELDVNLVYGFAYPWTAIVPEEEIEDLKTNPVGTGAYKFVEWIPQQHLKLTRNDEYFAKKANIANVEFKMIPDYTSQMAALKLGDIDIAEITPDQIESVNNEEGFKAYADEMNSIQLLGLNMENEKLKDIRVRQAIAKAIDKDEIISTVVWGNGTKVGSHLPKSSPFYADTNDIQGYDPEAAKALLAEAGYADGLTLKLTLPKNYQTHVDTGLIIADQLARVGITAEVELVEWAAWMSEVYGNKNYEMTVVAHSGRLDAYNFLSRYHSQSGDYLSLITGEVDALLDAATKELNADSQRQIYNEIQELLSTNAPAVYIQSLQKFYAMADNVNGMQVYPIDMINLKEISFE